MTPTTRRRFLQTAALPLAAVPTIAEAGDEPTNVDQSLLAIVRHRHKHLTDAQFKAVQTALQRGLATADVLKNIRLDPNDEPATIFVADVGE